MKKLLVKEIKELEEHKEASIKAIQAFLLKLKEIDKKVQDYSCNRSDRWYDSESCDKHYDWENRIDLKYDELSDILEMVENFDISSIKERDLTDHEREKDITNHLQLNIKKINELLDTQTKLLKKSKIILKGE